MYVELGTSACYYLMVVQILIFVKKNCNRVKLPNKNVLKLLF